jgi:hypothetical protein
VLSQNTETLLTVSENPNNSSSSANSETTNNRELTIEKSSINDPMNLISPQQNASSTAIDLTEDEWNHVAEMCDMEDKKHYSNKTMTKCVFLNNCSNVTLHFS